jgi:hypothetical protein
MPTRHRPTAFFALAAALMATAPLAVCMAQDAAYRPIEQRMPDEVRRASGLAQMTPEQLAVLNAWLRQEQQVETETVRARIQEERKGFGGLFGMGKDVEPIVSKLVGEFRGWEGNTVFELHNGQRWQVTDTPSYYVPKRSASQEPAVSISPSPMGAWRLQVENHSVRAKVRRLK